MAEKYQFLAQYEAMTFLPAAEQVLFTPPGAIAISFCSQPLALVAHGGIEEYSFFISERFNFGEFPSGPAGSQGEKGEDGAPGEQGPPGVGIPEVFIDDQPATLTFYSVIIEGETVYQMQVQAT